MGLRRGNRRGLRFLASIAQIGNQYNLILKAVNCSSGESLASTEAQASDKNHVLDTLGKAATDMRSKLGESLSTIHKFDTPLDQATTPSLEALQAYSLGLKALEGNGDSAAAVPLFQHAAGLDPNFATRTIGNSRNLRARTPMPRSISAAQREPQSLNSDRKESSSIWLSGANQ